MNRWVGRWIAAVGIIHVTFGLIVFGEPLLAILRDGVWDAVDGHPGRPLAFWFVFLGLFTILFGMVIDWIERQGLWPPRKIGLPFLALVIVGIVTMPIGGGWLLLPAGIAFALRSSREHGGAKSDA